MTREHILLEVDRSELFDMVAKTGDGGEAIGTRLVGLLLGDDSATTAIGLACYGIVCLPDAAAAIRALPATGEVGRG